MMQFYSVYEGGCFPGGSVVKNPPANAEDVGLIPGTDDSLKKEMATHSNILVWKIPWTEEPGGLQSVGSQSQTQLSMHTARGQVCRRAK